MSRALTFFGLFLFAVGAYFGIRDFRQSQAEIARLKSQPEQVNGATPSARRPSTIPVSDPAIEATKLAQRQKQDEIQTLQLRLNQEKQILAAQMQALKDLQAQRALAQKENAEQVSGLISARTDEVQSLSDFLQNQRLAEKDLWDAADLSLRVQSNRAMWERDQIDQSIRSLEAGLRENQSQLQAWNLNTSDITLKAAQIQALQDQSLQIQQQLAALAAERSNIATRTYLQGQAISDQTQAQKEDLIESENEILERITGIREELRSLRQSRTREPSVSPTLLEQIQQAQMTQNEQAARIQALEETLRQAQEELSQTR